MTDDALSAQDITQNTMETAWRNLHKLRSRRQIRSWVFHIAKEETDKCLSGKRRADLSFEEVEAELNPELLIEESADILKTLLEREQSDQIIAALNLLSPRYQSVVKLWRWQSQPEGDRESDGNEPQHHADLSAQRTESIPQSVCVFKLRIG